jgi:hypothetical protein
MASTADGCPTTFRDSMVVMPAEGGVAVFLVLAEAVPFFIRGLFLPATL